MTFELVALGGLFFLPCLLASLVVVLVLPRWHRLHWDRFHCQKQPATVAWCRRCSTAVAAAAAPVAAAVLAADQAHHALVVVVAAAAAPVAAAAAAGGARADRPGQCGPR